MLTSTPAQRITGIILIVLVPIIIVTAVSGLGVDPGAADFGEELQDLADREEAPAVLSFLLAAIFVVAAAAMYVTFRSREPTLALFGSLGFFAAATGFLAAAATGEALMELADDFGSARGGQAEGVVPAARAVATINEAAVLAGLGFFSLGVLAFGILVLRTVALPPWLGWLAVVGGVLGFVGIPIFLPALLGWVLGLLWLLITGGLLVWRGTREADVAA